MRCLQFYDYWRVDSAELVLFMKPIYRWPRFSSYGTATMRLDGNVIQLWHFSIRLPSRARKKLTSGCGE